MSKMREDGGAFLASCDRDAKGRCLPSAGGGGKDEGFVGKEESHQMRKSAMRTSITGGAVLGTMVLGPIGTVGGLLIGNSKGQQRATEEIAKEEKHRAKMLKDLAKAPKAKKDAIRKSLGTQASARQAAQKTVTAKTVGGTGIGAAVGALGGGLAGGPLGALAGAAAYGLAGGLIGRGHGKDVARKQFNRTATIGSALGDKRWKKKREAEFAKMLRERMALGPNGLAEDVLYALRTLREAIPQAALANAAERKSTAGGHLVLEDLRKQAEVAESTHDPENTKKLIDSLNAYLDEELREEPEDVEEGQMAETGAPEETGEEVEEEMSGEEDAEEEQPAPAAAQPATIHDKIRDKVKASFMEAIDEVMGGSDEEAPDEEAPIADDEEEAPVEGEEEDTPMHECEACGHKSPLKEEGATTGAAPAPLSEGATTGAAAGPVGESETNSEAQAEDKEEEKKMKESGISNDERAELLALRAQRRQSDLLLKAQKVIRESGVLHLEAADLTQFPEGQWAAIVKMCGRGDAGMSGAMEPDYGLLRESESPALTNSTSARDFFERTLQ